MKQRIPRANGLSKESRVIRSQDICQGAQALPDDEDLVPLISNGDSTSPVNSKEHDEFPKEPHSLKANGLSRESRVIRPQDIRQGAQALPDDEDLVPLISNGDFASCVNNKEHDEFHRERHGLKANGLSRESRVVRPCDIRQRTQALPDNEDSMLPTNSKNTVLSVNPKGHNELSRISQEPLSLDVRQESPSHKAALPETAINTTPTKVTQCFRPVSPVPAPNPQSSSRSQPKMVLDDLAKAVLGCVKIIKYGDLLYYYTGKTYRVIGNGSQLLRLIRSQVSNSAFGSTSVRKFSDLLVFLQSDDTLVPQDLDSRLTKAQYYVVFQNGVLDLWDMKLLLHSHKYLTFYELDAFWNKDTHSPTFENFLEKISGGDTEIIQRIKEVMGYLLSPVNEGKYFFVMGTTPNSGKSTLGELLRKLLGSENVISRAPYQMSGRFTFGDIHGKLLDIAPDLPNGKFTPVTTAIIKQITGGDTITVEQKYENMKEVKSRMRFLFGSNFPVSIYPDNSDEAFWDRMILLPFLYPLKKEEEDPLILQKLLNEKEAIIYKCLMAFHKVLRNHCIFSYCKAAEEMKSSWRYCKENSSQSIIEFSKKFIMATGDPKDWLYSQDLYRRYIEFCECESYDYLSYTGFLSWMCHNIEGCQQKRVHLTNHNPRSALIGIRFSGLAEECTD